MLDPLNKPNDTRTQWTKIGSAASVVALLVLSVVYDLAAVVLAFMSAHDNFSRGSDDRSVESALGVLVAAMAGQLMLAGIFTLNDYRKQAITVAIGSTPLVLLVGFLMLLTR